MHWVLLDIFGNILGENQDTTNPSSLQRIQRCSENGKGQGEIAKRTLLELGEAEKAGDNFQSG